MKDTRDEILISLDGLNSEQMNKVLSFIKTCKRLKNQDTSTNEFSSTKEFKRRALREIQMALNGKVFAV